MIATPSPRDHMIERAMVAVHEICLDSTPAALQALKELADSAPNGLVFIGRILLEVAAEHTTMVAHRSSNRMVRLHHECKVAVICEHCRRRRIGNCWGNYEIPRGWIVQDWRLCPDCQAKKAAERLGRQAQ